MSVLSLTAVTATTLRGAELSLAAGVHAVLGTEADGSAELIALAAGVARPRRGRVLVAGHDPHGSPDVRRRTASLLAEERLIPAASVGESVARALSLAGQRSSAAETLAALELSGWAGRRLSSLDATERRSVALALALAKEEPALVALYEPLSGVPGVGRCAILERLARLADGGACVVCATASAADARELSSSLLVLSRGRFVRRAAAPLSTDLAPGTAPDFIVLSDDARRLAAELAADTAVAAVHWDQEQSPDEVRVRGGDAEQLALSIARAAITRGIRVRAISPALPALDIVRGASDGLARAAYEQAYRRAQARTRPRPGAPVYGATTGAAGGEPPEQGGGA